MFCFRNFALNTLKTGLRGNIFRFSSPHFTKQLENILSKNLFDIDPIVNTLDRKQLSLAYSPGVGEICLAVDENPDLVNLYTMRNRSVAIVSDGSMLDSEGKKFMPVMDWFVSQVKYYSGYDAFPFVIRKQTNLEDFFNDLATTYGTILYLDNKKIKKFPENTLVINHQDVIKMTKTELTDAEKTAHIITVLKKEKMEGVPRQADYARGLVTEIQKRSDNHSVLVIPEGSMRQQAIEFHKNFEGKIFTRLNFTQIEYFKRYFTEANLRKLIEKDVYSKTSKLAAIVTDGTAVLGFGNIGPKAALPVMQGKSQLFKIFGQVDVVPFCMYPKNDVHNEIEAILNAVSNFASVNLEDIKAPECFTIQQTISQSGIMPVFHDDQHGTAIVTLAGLISALKVANKQKSKLKIVINGAGAAGVAIAKLIDAYFPKGQVNMVCLDSKGAIYKGRTNNMNQFKVKLSEFTNSEKEKGQLQECLKNADIFLGVSQADVLKGEWVKTMNEKPIIFAMANPNPEILPEDAKKNGAFIYGSGRSDFQNQINNSLVFPGIFRAIKEHDLKAITMQMKLNTAKAIAKLIQGKETPGMVIVDSLRKDVAVVISDQIGKNR